MQEFTIISFTKLVFIARILFWIVFYSTGVAFMCSWLTALQDLTALSYPSLYQAASFYCNVSSHLSA